MFSLSQINSDLFILFYRSFLIRFQRIRCAAYHLDPLFSMRVDYKYTRLKPILFAVSQFSRPKSQPTQPHQFSAYLCAVIITCACVFGASIRDAQCVAWFLAQMVV